MEFKNFKPEYIVRDSGELERLEKILKFLDDHTSCKQEELAPVEVLVKTFWDDEKLPWINIYPQEGFVMPFFNHYNSNDQGEVSKDHSMGFQCHRNGYEIGFGNFSYTILFFPLSEEKLEFEKWKREDAKFESKYPNSFNKIKKIIKAK
jgi:hypothetical protein